MKKTPQFYASDRSTSAIAFARLAHAHPFLLRSLVLCMVCGTLLGSHTLAADNSFTINVRTSVEREYTLFSKKPAIVHSKLYALAWIKQSPNDLENALVSPVDENALLQQLHDVLAARGFHEPKPGQFPDVVLTVLYGRSRLKNPYEKGEIPVSGGQLGGGQSGPGAVGPAGNIQDSVSSGGGGAEVEGGADMLMTDRTPGLAEKRIRAGGEKVFLSVTAWEYPGLFPSAKPKMLWRATMNVDDPTLDLNTVGGTLLTVGAPYFDREIDHEEISLSSTLTPVIADRPPTDTDKPVK